MYSSVEESNPKTRNIDTLPTLEVLRLIGDEDALVAGAVRAELPAIAVVVEGAVEALSSGGRLIYVGAGTSGRLGVLDAAECLPTYGVDREQVVAVLAGGAEAIASAVENAEDDPEAGALAMRALGVCPADLVLGIASSGRTPYVVGALRQARMLGAATAALVGNREGPVAAAAQSVVAPRTGPEAITGSTRMKAGTAQKMVLNMISTAAMIRLGRTYGNLMVDMKPTNDKLRDRSARIVAVAAGVDAQVALRALADADSQIKTAIVMLIRKESPNRARERLARAG
ncbi:MAG: N-acetylmuramic acid 6-phosphate etherase, partial [Chloroflexota bacterium]